MSEAESLRESALQPSERLMRGIFDGALDAMVLTDPEGRVVDANAAACELFGRSRKALAGRDLADLCARPEQARQAWHALAEHGRTRGELEIRRSDGSSRLTEYSASNVGPGVDLAVLRDVTVRRETEAALRRADAALLASEDKYRRIIETTSEGVLTVDTTGRLTLVNRRLADLLGHAREEMIGRPVFDFMDEDTARGSRERLERRRRGIAESLEMPFRHKAGHPVWVHVNSNPLFDADGRFEGSFALVTDIGERRRADELRSRLAAIVESTDDAIIATDLGGTVTTWNRSAERLYGYRAEEIVGRPVAVLYPPEVALDQAAVAARIARGEVVETFETTRVRKDGSRVEVSITVSPIHDGEGRVVGASKIARDLTERRKSEAQLRRTEEHLRHAQKMEAVGSLAGGIAHDFNNLLSVILTYTHLALQELKAGEPLRADIEQIDRSSQRAAELTRQLLAFSRKQILEPQVVDLNTCVVGLEKILGRVLGEHIALSLLLDRGVGKIYADPGQIEQVIMNLVVNAHDAMPHGGSLTIETANVHLDALYGIEHAGVPPGDYVLLAVTDTGIGMDHATLQRIFEPFFTTKERGKGTGLGLSTVFGIVKQSGGHIWVYSEPGVGTTFKVYMPRTDRTADDNPTPPPAPTSLRGTETVLVVEDEDAVRATFQTVLRRQGYNVLEAQNGGEALLICEQYGARIDLLLTDVVMPRMSGRQLADRLRKVRPDLKVLYVSGYTENTIVHHGILDAGIAYLPKPVTPENLLRKIREILDLVRP